MMNSGSVFAVIPAYNAADTLADVVGRLRASLPGVTVVIVDDGSTDDTAVEAERLDVLLLRHPRNRGKGAALKTGFKAALAQGAKVVLTLDADGQHEPDEAVKLLKALDERALDVALGSRMHDLRRMPVHRILSNTITSRLISWRLGVRISDSQSGFRAMRREVLEKMELVTDRFETESELLLRAGLAGFEIGAVSVKTIYPKQGRSAMRAVDIYRFIALFLKSLTWRKNPAAHTKTWTTISE
ncbi:MAG: glycosyltransferase family 2 protein [Calditrichaeota bacterium]|nr:MAG: glycosyltransferase family 2 protein [Calditrichota bacterium]